MSVLAQTATLASKTIKSVGQILQELLCNTSLLDQGWKSAAKVDWVAQVDDMLEQGKPDTEVYHTIEMGLASIEIILTRAVSDEVREQLLAQRVELRVIGFEVARDAWVDRLTHIDNREELDDALTEEQKTTWGRYVREQDLQMRLTLAGHMAYLQRVRYQIQAI